MFVLGGYLPFTFQLLGEPWLDVCVVPAPLYFYRSDGSTFPTARRFY